MLLLVLQCRFISPILFIILLYHKQTKYSRGKPIRTLSATLTANQASVGVDGLPQNPLHKIVLSRSGQTTRGYDKTRILSISHIETEANGVATVLLDNSDTALTSIDFEAYKGILSYGYASSVARSVWVADTVYSLDDIVIPITANGFQYRASVAGTSNSSEPTFPTDLGVTVVDNTVTWEMDGNTSDEYSRTAPLYVVAPRGNRLFSAQGVLVCQVNLIGIPNRLGIDLAESELTLTEGDARTVKTLISAVANATLTPYTNYTNYTTTYDSEDTLIDSFKPKEAFRVGLNVPRLNRIQKLRSWTGSKMRAEADEALHFFDPTISGTSYDYEYKLAVSGEHSFFDKELINRFVNPNKEVVRSHPSHQPQYTSSATSATSFALFPQTHTTQLRLTSTTEANNIAIALIETDELDAENGAVKVPMNVGQEVWDWIKVTDSRQGDSRTGNVRYLQRNVSRQVFDMDIRFGKTAILPSPVLVATAAGGGRVARDPNITNLINAVNGLRDGYDGLNADFLTLVEFLNQQIEDGYFRKLTATDELHIPGDRGT